jgi:hypothetical protein
VLVALAFIAGAVRVAMWARREKRWLAGAAIVASPIAVMLGVIASSGAWNLHNYRYIAPAFPLVIAIAAIGVAPVRLPAWLMRRREARYAWPAALAIVGALFASSAWAPMKEAMQVYAQDVVDLGAQVVTLGRYIHARLPDARIMFHDAGAISYYGDTEVYDMLGLVTNHQADVANNGPGSRFEFLESLPPEARPTHFAYYRPWMGQAEMFGDTVLHTPRQQSFAKTFVGGDDMELIVASWDHVHTAERPLVAHPGWAMVDRLDVADLVSERDHHWVGRLGRRNFADPTARWSFVEREVLPDGLAVDGGRTIRGGGEHFDVTIDPAKPAKLVLRTGGQPSYSPWQELIDKPVTLVVLVDDAEIGRLEIPPPKGRFVELELELPKGGEIRTEATGPYRAFHWFVLQPE